jgi:hypothetical protein
MAKIPVKNAGRPAGWLRRAPVWTVAAAGAAVLATGGVALASTTSSASGQIRACYRPGSNPSQLKVLTGAGSHCPRGYQTLTWNIAGRPGPAGPKGAMGRKGATGPQGGAGPQGPAGVATGMTMFHQGQIDVNGGPANPVTVMTGPAAPATGVYFLNASLTLDVSAEDIVACNFLPDSGERSDEGVEQTGSTHGLMDLSLTGAVSLQAGQRPSVSCNDSNPNRNARTFFFQGNLNAILIGKSSGDITSATARHLAPQPPRIPKRH